MHSTMLSEINTHTLRKSRIANRQK